MAKLNIGINQTIFMGLTDWNTLIFDAVVLAASVQHQWRAEGMEEGRRVRTTHPLPLIA